MSRGKTRVRRASKGGDYPTNRTEKRKRATAKRNYFLNKYTANTPLKKIIPTVDINNADYSAIKYSYLEPGTQFSFRSKEQLTPERMEERPMWVNYSATKGKPSFLLLNETGQLNERVPKGMSKHFGPWLNTIEIKRRLLILHFPVDYEDLEKQDNYTAYYEGAVRQICVLWRMPICADGYTLDFLFSPHTSKYLGWDGLNMIPGYRELCILKPKQGETIELLRSEYRPIE